MTTGQLLVFAVALFSIGFAAGFVVGATVLASAFRSWMEDEWQMEQEERMRRLYPQEDGEHEPQAD